MIGNPNKCCVTFGKDSPIDGALFRITICGYTDTTYEWFSISLFRYYINIWRYLY